jgi:hypothetical protein
MLQASALDVSSASPSLGQRAKNALSKHAVEALSSTRALLGVTEKALDGLPVYGPKAVVAALSEVLKIAQVSCDASFNVETVFLIHESQTKYENDEAMVEASDDIKHLSDTMDQSIAGRAIPISPHLEGRVRALQRPVISYGSETWSEIPAQHTDEV